MLPEEEDRLGDELDEVKPLALGWKPRPAEPLWFAHPERHGVFAKYGLTRDDRPMVVWLMLDKERGEATVLTARDADPQEVAYIRTVLFNLH